MQKGFGIMASVQARTRDRRIRLEIKPVCARFRLLSAIISTPLFAIGIVAAVKVVIALLAGESYSPYQWFIGVGIATFFTVIPAVGIYVVLKGASVLSLDPQAGNVVLARRFAFRTWTRSIALAVMPEPEVRFDPGDNEDPRGFSIIIHMPNGGTFHYYGDGRLSLREQEVAMEDLRARIQALIVKAARS